MATNEPVAEAMPANQDYGPPIPWEEGSRRLADMVFYTLTTLNANGTPHSRPLLGVWLEGAIYFSSHETSHKGQNIARDGRCSLHSQSLKPKPLDLVVEGNAQRVTDDALLHRLKDAYASKYGWQVEVKDGKFDAAFGAPTAGTPPYCVFQLTPSVIYGFPGVGGEGGDDTADPLTPTRWRFEK
jgi:hypothetical protein